MTTPTAQPLDLPPLFGPEMRADPYPVYRRLRETDPVHWHEPFGAWVLTRYDDVIAALHDPRFSAERAGKMQEMTGSEELRPFFAFLSSRMLYADPPRHTRLRTLVSKAFTPHAVEAMRPHIQGLVDQFLDRVQGQGRMDVIADLAYPLPVTVIVEMLGVPVRDRDRLKQWSDDFVAYFAKHPAQVTPEEYRRAVQAVAAEREYFGAAVAPLRQHPRPDLLSAMVHAEEGGDRLTEDELHGSANLLLTAGHETTTNLIGNGTLALLRHPDQLAKLRADPSLLPGAVEEFLRYDGPVQFTHRLAKEDIALRGQTIRKGQFVYLMLAAANRDPARFPDPDRLDIARKDNHHVAFGQGPHFCLGAPLARLEAQIAFGTLLRRFPTLSLAADRLEYRETFNLHGLKALPVQFGAGS
jgi:cytochrome P450